MYEEDVKKLFWIFFNGVMGEMRDETKEGARM
jgi:hypothetical protein